MKRFALAFALVLATPAFAFAQAQDPAQEAVVLQGDLERFAAETEGKDCGTACRALESMRRAADRICVIDSGDRCAHAEDLLRQAALRVRASCPECSIAQERRPTQPVAPAMAPPPAPPQPAAESTLAVERRQGGCAGCTTTSTEAPAPAPLLLLAAAIAACTRRRKKQTGS